MTLKLIEKIKKANQIEMFDWLAKQNKERFFSTNIKTPFSQTKQNFKIFLFGLYYLKFFKFYIFKVL
jgi:hypothetical protein